MSRGEGTGGDRAGSEGHPWAGRAARGMAIAGLRGAVGRVRAALLPSRSAAEMRKLTAGLSRAVRGRLDAPVDVRELGAALCAEMSARRGGRPVKLRFERFPDGIGVTGLWMEFPDFDLVIVEERAETVQQLVILGHELWHMHAGHCHRHLPGPDAATLARSDEAGEPGEPNGSGEPGRSYDSGDRRASAPSPLSPSCPPRSGRAARPSRPATARTNPTSRRPRTSATGSRPSSVPGWTPGRAARPIRRTRPTPSGRPSRRRWAIAGTGDEGDGRARDDDRGPQPRRLLR